jgi:hypothetical protein
MGASVSLQIKCVIESFSTEGTKISLCVTMTLHVSIKEPLQCKALGADTTCKFGWILIASDCRKFIKFLNNVTGQWILDAKTSIDYFHRRIRAETQSL